MKLKITIAFVLLLFAFSCKKDANKTQLIGKWTEVSATTAPGGRPVFFQVNTPGPAYVQFGGSGVIQTDFFINCTKYSVAGGYIVLTYNDGPTISNVNYDYSISHDTLKMNDRNCVGGCPVVFVKE